MRYSQVPFLVASLIGLAQGLVLPDAAKGLSSVVKARDASTEFGDVVARALTCSGTTQCTTCPGPNVKSGKCPVGANCKRSIDEDGEPHVSSLEARVKIPFDRIKSGNWGPGKVIETAGLSFCSVMAVYDQGKWIMAHIPPAREENGQLINTGEDVIDGFKEAMTSKYNDANMQGPQGYLLVNTVLDPDLLRSMQSWFQQRNIPTVVQPYTREQTIAGSGNFVISREAVAWPPIVTFI
ncbi:hypothetical protein JX265_003371 [Neoarthrinium moseri]|uniref:Uncharacterized protein n=1 Tax=Neoarthrinium moseri TaxID=1658444 RepID=A0A9P9WS29_9PEZI|nr:uncharacterized protein JN550_000795 [Neoarthrinium moseri]KAI1849998.1 hypothetical protein JX266_004377 [Neoarthrinium moseri]KAI1876723.1 hypothetical protein JN550_000795 [Neoarthrinium moseri]KAI1877363.1 hypothetical protein JX265_003371 [Neoarthrinium moseri]